MFQQRDWKDDLEAIYPHGNVTLAFLRKVSGRWKKVIGAYLHTVLKYSHRFLLRRKRAVHILRRVHCRGGFQEILHEQVLY